MAGRLDRGTSWMYTLRSPDTPRPALVPRRRKAVGVLQTVTLGLNSGRHAQTSSINLRGLRIPAILHAC